jgi:nucleotidyltransferase-like protein
MNAPKRLAFITGSHAYGTPTEKSDIDLVVRVTKETRDRLIDLLAVELTSDNEYGDGVLQIKTGKLNLIFALTDAQFDAWKNSTQKLIMQAPVTREQAVTLIAAALAKTDPITRDAIDDLFPLNLQGSV